MIEYFASAWRVGSQLLLLHAYQQSQPLGVIDSFRAKGTGEQSPMPLPSLGAGLVVLLTWVTCVYYLPIGIPSLCSSALIRGPSACASLVSSQSFWLPEWFRVSVTTGFISCHPRASTRHTFSYLLSSGLLALLRDYRCL